MRHANKKRNRRCCEVKSETYVCTHMRAQNGDPDRLATPPRASAVVLTATTSHDDDAQKARLLCSLLAKDFSPLKSMKSVPSCLPTCRDGDHRSTNKNVVHSLLLL
ncbi:unnamed protein product [Pylaiella littoralis]